MFARTKRLTLRPGWPEDAPAVARAIGHEEVVRMLARVPWPYRLADAEDFLARPRAATEIHLMILTHEQADAAPRLVGAIGVAPQPEGHELGYWLTPDAWGRGYATEAGRAVVAMARHGLGLKRLVSCHFIDNPASGRVLAKLGFRPTGLGTRHSWGRGAEVQARELALDLSGQEEDADTDDTRAMAA
jgi:RimJ/RimL family protein N-acetyltransferase